MVAKREVAKRFDPLTKSTCMSDKVYSLLVYILVIGTLVIVGYPLYNMVICSFSEPNAIYQGKVLFYPVGLTYEAYAETLNYPMIWTGYRNSLFYTTAGTLINLVVTTLAAYPLARRDLCGRNVVTLLFTFTMFFNGGLVPTYMVIMRLDMIDTIWALLIPSAMSVWNMIIMRTFFQSTIPEELYEATLLDGGNDWDYLKSVVLPLSKAIMAVMTLHYAVGHWNNYFSVLIYLNTDALCPLQVFLRRILVLNEVEADMMNLQNIADLAEMKRRMELMKYVLIIVSSLPMLILYPFIQKYFIKGVMIGSIKG